MVQRVQVLAVVQVPEHGLHVLASGRAERAIGGDSHCVQVARVAQVVDLQLAVGQMPDLVKKDGNIRPSIIENSIQLFTKL